MRLGRGTDDGGLTKGVEIRPSTRGHLSGDADTDLWLTQAEAATRLAHYGPNEIAEHKINPLLKFLSYFWGPIPWMIEIAVVLSGAVGQWPDFFIILLLLVAQRGGRICRGTPARRSRTPGSSRSTAGYATNCSTRGASIRYSEPA